MCWLGKIDYQNSCRISDGNVKCFKVLGSYDGERFGYSYYKGFRYSVGETYVNERMPSPNPILPKAELFEFSDGVFHSYSGDGCELICEYGALWILPKSSMRKAFGFTNTKLPIAECTIPEGCAYYVNQVGEVVSQGIRIDGICTADEYIARKSKND